MSYEIYDVDRRDNRSPHHLGVLSHFDAVIWYTGDDYLTRLPGQPPGTGTARLAAEEMIDVRHFLNEGGKLLYTGKYAGSAVRRGQRVPQLRLPGAAGGHAAGRRADGERAGAAVLQQERTSTSIPSAPAFKRLAGVRRGRPDAGRRLHPAQRRLPPVLPGGLHLRAPGKTFDDDAGRPYGLAGTEGGPFEGLSWLFDETGANNQDHSATFVVTSSVLDPEQYPLYADSQSAASWLRPGAAPFDPFSGTQYMAAGANSSRTSGSARWSTSARPPRRSSSSSSRATWRRTGTGWSSRRAT